MEAKNYNCPLPPKYSSWRALYEDVLLKGLFNEKEVCFDVSVLPHESGEYKQYNLERTFDKYSPRWADVFIYRFTYSLDFLKARMWDDFQLEPVLNVNDWRNIEYALSGYDISLPKSELRNKVEKMTHFAYERERINRLTKDKNVVRPETK